jgi:hypothetical protein
MGAYPLLLVLVVARAAGAGSWQIPVANAILVTDDAPAGPVALAIDSFVKRVALLSGESLTVQPAGALTAEDRQKQHWIVVGNPQTNPWVAEEIGDQLEKDFAGEKGWVIEEGYRLEIRGNVPKGEKGVVLAASLGRRGVVYALSDLEMKLAYANGRTVLALGPEASGESVIDDAEARVSRVGSWVSDAVSPYVGGAASYISEKDVDRSEMTALFSGTQLDLVARKGDNTGVLAWSIDEGKGGQGEVDLYAPTLEWQARMPLARDLEDGLHVVTFRHAGRHHPLHSDHYPGERLCRQSSGISGRQSFLQRPPVLSLGAWSGGEDERGLPPTNRIFPRSRCFPGGLLRSGRMPVLHLPPRFRENADGAFRDL